ncbi:hypothetical protein SORBI_3006G018751 [Sorghum bicolor]|uniref:Uncharacterized protein n=1 Tax=Sorghum bicolor TaxID=4558 RepID=A0A1Z5RBL2_SORBI|nr:hypothetical protein SORBI_3006G018751 [Sorghum bicolor]
MTLSKQLYHHGSLDGQHLLNRDRQFVHFGLYQDFLRAPNYFRHRFEKRHHVYVHITN